MERADASLYAHFGPDVFSTAYRATGNWEDAEDATQEAFLRLLRERAKGVSIKNPLGWAFATVINLARDGHKSAYCSKRMRQGFFPNLVPSGVPEPLAILEQGELLGQFQDAMSRLSRPDRLLLRLRYRDDFSAAEIAEILSSNPKAIHERLSRARQRLATILREKGELCEAV